MFLNVSGRTDIVAFYSEWFINRYRKGFVDVRNPFYENQVSRIYFKSVDAIIFCTKNPIPMIKYLSEIKKPIIFQVTITPYKKDIEPNVISKKEIIESVKKISNNIGMDNIYIRYDPIFLSPKYNINYHIKAFNRLCSLLSGYVKKIIVSFIDDYKNVQVNSKILNIKSFTEDDYIKIGQNFSKIAKKYNMTVQTCSEEIRLLEYGFIKDDCLSRNLAFKLSGKTKFKTWRGRNNKNCNCVEMVDIGVYNTCKHYCKYCYANFNEKEVDNNYKRHNKESSLLIGNLKENDIIKERKE